MMVLTVVFFILTAPMQIAADSPAAGISVNSSASSAGCENKIQYVITNDDVLNGKGIQKDAEIRDFIWKRWHERRAGCLTEERYSKEGIPAKTTFRIDQDKAGGWNLSVTREWPPREGSNPEHDHIEYTAYSIQRIEHTPNRGAHKIPVTEVRSGETYQLVFYDSKGIRVGGI